MADFITVSHDVLANAQPGDSFKMTGRSHGKATIVAINPITSTLVVHFAGQSYSVGNRHSMLGRGYDPAHMVVYNYEAHPYDNMRARGYWACYQQITWKISKEAK